MTSAVARGAVAGGQGQAGTGPVHTRLPTGDLWALRVLDPDEA